MYAIIPVVEGIISPKLYLHRLLNFANTKPVLVTPKLPKFIDCRISHVWFSQPSLLSSLYNSSLSCVSGCATHILAQIVAEKSTRRMNTISANPPSEGTALKGRVRSASLKIYAPGVAGALHARRECEKEGIGGVDRGT